MTPVLDMRRAHMTKTRSTVIVAAILAAALLIAPVVHALTGITISFQILNAAQDTYIQTKLIPRANTALCTQFNLSASCTASQLTTAGCVALAASAITAKNRVYQNCTPFTLDAAGESAFAADIFATHLLSGAGADSAADSLAFCQAFRAASGANQNTVCTTLGQPAGCAACQ